MKKTAILVTALTACGADGAQAANNRETMAKAFMEWCSAPIPSWDAMNVKATGEKLKVAQHRRGPLSKNGFIEEKMWSVNDKRGIYSVDAVHSSRKGKQTASCSVYFDDLMNNDFPAYFGEQLGLGKPHNVTRLGGGKQITVWDTAPDVRIMLTPGGVGGHEGTAINRMQILEPDR